MKYLPNEPKEYAFIGSAIARFGTVISGITLFASNHWVTLGSVFLTWFGHELHAYFKLQQNLPEDDK